MRLNQCIARATGMSRRQADAVIAARRVEVNGQAASLGQVVNDNDHITLDNKPLPVKHETVTILLHKPVGYVCSRNGQGSRTVYDLLPVELHDLKPVGRLDKDSSGLLLLTNDGNLANELTHPRYAKTKSYDVSLDKPLTEADRAQISQQGVQLEDGLSQLELSPQSNDHYSWKVRMQEGRNRQIRRTFAAKGYTVVKLHRTQFGDYRLEQVGNKRFISL